MSKNSVSKKSLLQSNSYLRDPVKYKTSLITSVSSSTAIETATSTSAVALSLKDILDRPKIKLKKIKLKKF